MAFDVLVACIIAEAIVNGQTRSRERVRYKVL